MTNSSHPPERITPLPWFVDVCNSGLTCWCRTIGNKQGDDSNEHCVAPSGTLKTADAEYIVHCANNYPKLEALNLEFVKNAEQLVYDWGNADVRFETIERFKALIQKAKGGV